MIENFDLTLLKKELLTNWTAKTKLGKLIQEKKIKNLEELFEYKKVIQEREAILSLLPNEIKTSTYDVRVVKRTKRTGRTQRYRVAVVVGLKNYVGYAVIKDKEMQKSVQKAKLKAIKNLKPVIMGCGSLECNCTSRHSIRKQVRNKFSSLVLTLIPSRIGIGRQVSKIGQEICEMVDLKDIRSNSERGNTQIAINYIKAFIKGITE